MSIMVSALMLSSFVLVTRQVYTLYQGIDLSGGEISIRETECSGKKTFLFVIKMGESCEDHQAAEEPKSSAVTSVDGPTEDPPEGATPNGNIDGSSSLKSGTDNETKASSQILPYFLSILCLIFSIVWLFRRRTISRKKVSFERTPMKSTDNLSQEMYSSNPLLSSELPASLIRQELILFERKLDPRNRRHPQETVTAWVNRIGLQASILTYLQTRYDSDQSVADGTTLEEFKNQLDIYLSQHEKE
ncbi:MAG: hypothetical protein LPK26_20710 [Bacillaceae bacterium]|uniref:DUF4129 domain-containing protein n=1 Tax=Exiguobacterium aurantiacum TaxID=33987 RepID=A0A377HH74_9BACL|nr:hypothetical protein [Exiguobacterium aurantiacum]MEB1809680.1 hypothetical protein [Bacillaceae bacterium]STO53270.1 Uncharacterised protein [Exiguobacterium aurantiacum]